MRSEAAVSVVDDDSRVLDSLRWLVESDGLRVEAFTSGRTFLAQFDADRVGCVVLDVRLPGASGLDVQMELARRQAPTPVIVISGYATTRMAVEAMKHGAFDFIEKPLDEQRLLERIQEALAADERRRAVRAWRAENRLRLGRLTPHERAVLDLVVAGKKNEVIAGELGMKKAAVSLERSRIYEKLGVRHVAELVRLVEAAQPVGG